MAEGGHAHWLLCEPHGDQPEAASDVQAGRLLEQDGEGLFSFRVFPIEARERKRIEMKWSQWLERRAKTVHYKAPVTRRDAAIVISLVQPRSTAAIRVELKNIDYSTTAGFNIAAVIVIIILTFLYWRFW